MTPNQKRIRLFLLMGSLLSLVVLATSLSNLQLQPGSALPASTILESASANGDADSLTPAYFSPLLRGIFALVFLAVVLYLPARLFALIDLQKIFQVLLLLVLFITIVYLLPLMAPGQAPTFPADAAPLATPAPTLTFNAMEPPPQSLIWLVVGIIALGVIALFIALMSNRSVPASIEDQLLQEAEDALSAIAVSGNLRSVILRCYFQMTQVLQAEQDIARDNSMTVQEFERLLVAKGFPAAAVGQLTGLFEKARYGVQPMDADDEDTARASLDAIIRFCRQEGN
ncbi:MAG: DUF4129 domain-containing protein [Anaerolineales bacterium]|nr:DUF4129 domain-containing protein [Anaerolineales bacterium]